MIPQTLDEALAILDSRGLTLWIARADGTTLAERKDAGLRPLAECALRLRDEMAEATVVDKVIGLAAAKLAVWAGVSRVWAGVASSPAVEWLRKCDVAHDARQVVPNILNSAREAVCPMEVLSQQIDDLDACVRAIAERMGISVPK